MKTRREFIRQGGTAAVGAALLPSLSFSVPKRLALGVQLYTFRDEMASDPLKTLEKIAALGIKKIESAQSAKGFYYGLKPVEMKTTCENLGMTLVSGHVPLNESWEKTMEEALMAGQEYLICSSMPSRGQTVDNYRKVADAFNKAGEQCKERGLEFGYHNHDYEFESDQGEVLYDVLLRNTDANLVHMELDLGWVIMSGKDPLEYFKNYPRRFPLWHLKDMDSRTKQSTELGKGILDVPSMMAHQKDSGVKHIFIEQEEYSQSPLASMEHNMAYMNSL
jgi:sugar phosphate isomerase/epimerase